jgi:hypothetical protein
MFNVQILLHPFYSDLMEKPMPLTYRLAPGFKDDTKKVAPVGHTIPNSGG